MSFDSDTNVYDRVGFVTFEKATPILYALFGAFVLEDATPSEACLEIGFVHWTPQPTWYDIYLRLRGLVVGFSLVAKDDCNEELRLLLCFLATKYGYEFESEVYDFIANCDFEHNVEMQDLFSLARIFDDGHRIKAVRLEGGIYGDRCHVHAWHGAVEYWGAHYEVHMCTDLVASTASDIDQRLAGGDTASASKSVLGEVERLLAGVRDPQVRNQVRAQLGRALLADAPEGHSARSFVVHGRVPGDDEDSCIILDAADSNQAKSAFEEEMYASVEDSGAREAKRQAAIKRHGSAVFISSVCYADIGNIVSV